MRLRSASWVRPECSHQIVHSAASEATQLMSANVLSVTGVTRPISLNKAIVPIGVVLGETVQNVWKGVVEVIALKGRSEQTGWTDPEASVRIEVIESVGKRP